MLLILIMLLPIIAFGEVVIISNFPLRKTNLEKVINLENYKEMVEIIRNVEDVKDAYLVEEENRVTIYIERYPIKKAFSMIGFEYVFLSFFQRKGIHALLFKPAYVG